MASGIAGLLISVLIGFSWTSSCLMDSPSWARWEWSLWEQKPPLLEAVEPVVPRRPVWAQGVEQPVLLEAVEPVVLARPRGGGTLDQKPLRSSHPLPD